MDSSIIKYIIFAVVVLIFYLVRRSINRKLKEIQKQHDPSLQGKLAKQIQEEEEFNDDPEKTEYHEVQPESDFREFTEREHWEEKETNPGFREPDENFKADDFSKEEKNSDDFFEKRKESKKAEPMISKPGMLRSVKSSVKQDDFIPDVKNLRKAVIWSEILAPPVSERDE